MKREKALEASHILERLERVEFLYQDIGEILEKYNVDNHLIETIKYDIKVEINEITAELEEL